MTDEQKNTPSGTEQREENVDLYALFFKYFAYWPWFVASVLVCIISAFIYLRYQPPSIMLMRPYSSKKVTRKVEAAIILWEPFRIWVCSP